MPQGKAAHYQTSSKKKDKLRYSKFDEQRSQIKMSTLEERIGANEYKPRNVLMASCNIKVMF